MRRVLFEKTGDAVFMSHLDLMRLFQRAFKRAGMKLKHTQGFNPRPSVSIALPLSLGVHSCCELLDFELDGQEVSDEEVQNVLNRCLVAGVRVLRVYDGERKIRDLSLMHSRIALEYNNVIDHGCVNALRGLFARASLPVEKKSKNGPVEQDIVPMIRRLTVCAADEHCIYLDVLHCCQNPSLNPILLVSAIERYLPQAAPDHSICCRIEIYDSNETVFR